MKITLKYKPSACMRVWGMRRYARMSRYAHAHKYNARAWKRPPVRTTEGCWISATNRKSLDFRCPLTTWQRFQDEQTHQRWDVTSDKQTDPRCACAPRVNKGVKGCGKEQWWELGDRSAFAHRRHIQPTLAHQWCSFDPHTMYLSYFIKLNTRDMFASFHYYIHLN